MNRTETSTSVWGPEGATITSNSFFVARWTRTRFPLGAPGISSSVHCPSTVVQPSRLLASKSYRSSGVPADKVSSGGAATARRWAVRAQAPTAASAVRIIARRVIVRRFMASLLVSASRTLAVADRPDESPCLDPHALLPIERTSSGVTFLQSQVCRSLRPPSGSSPEAVTGEASEAQRPGESCEATASRLHPRPRSPAPTPGPRTPRRDESRAGTRTRCVALRRRTACASRASVRTVSSATERHRVEDLDDSGITDRDVKAAQRGIEEHDVGYPGDRLGSEDRAAVGVDVEQHAGVAGAEQPAPREIEVQAVGTAWAIGDDSSDADRIAGLDDDDLRGSRDVDVERVR